MPTLNIDSQPPLSKNYFQQGPKLPKTFWQQLNNTIFLTKWLSIPIFVFLLSISSKLKFPFIQFDLKSKDKFCMGQSSPTKKMEEPNQENIVKNIDRLFGQLSQSTKIEEVNDPLIMISFNLSQKGSFVTQETGFQANPILLKCVFHPNFQKIIRNLMKILSQQLKSILQTKIFALISRQKFRKALNIANFCIFFSNQSLIQTVNLLSVRSDLDPATKELVLSYTKDNPELNPQLLEDIQKETLGEIERILRLSMNMMVDLHMKLISRSDFTLKIIDRLNQSLFVLYNKIFFSEISEISKRQSHENAKTLLKIGSYFLGLGLEIDTPSIYQLAVLLLDSVITHEGQHLKSQKALPSHLFKSLPIVSHNEMMHWLTNTILFALRFIKEGTTVRSKININRIPSFKLLALIVKQHQTHDHQITYLFEEICLQTKTYQIQRVFVAQIATKYASLQHTSDIIKKYSQLGNINYNIKGNKKEVKIKPEDVRTELQDDEDSVRKEVTDLCSKYTIQVIFQKKEVTYEYSDKALWNMILYQMQEGESDLSKPAEVHLNKEGELEQS